MDFEEFPKIARLSRDVVLTEKIDGTNAQILLYHTHRSYNGEYLDYILHQYEPDNEHGDRLVLLAGSRNRWIKPGKSTDNSGFAGWVKAHAEELLALGEGRHYGEWWGQGIQRGYGLKEKRFSLFNTGRWTSEFNHMERRDRTNSTVCNEVPVCHVVPLIATIPFSTSHIETLLDILRLEGSYASPGFMKPEGVVIFHTASGYLFKKTIENDESPKSLVKG